MCKNVRTRVTTALMLFFMPEKGPKSNEKLTDDCGTLLRNLNSTAELRRKPASLLEFLGFSVATRSFNCGTMIYSSLMTNSAASFGLIISTTRPKICISLTFGSYTISFIESFSEMR